MNDTLLMVLIFAGWVALQRWVLPRFGIHTCLSPNSSCMSRRSGTDGEKPSVEVKKIDVETLKD